VIKISETWWTTYRTNYCGNSIVRLFVKQILGLGLSS